MDFIKAFKALPDLPIELVLYFDLARAGRNFKKDSIITFIEYYKAKHIGVATPPSIIAQTCDKLVETGWLAVLSRGGVEGLDNRYASSINDKWRNDLDFQKARNTMMSLMICGFPLIYETHKTSIYPVISEDKHNNYHVGTSFGFFKNYLITAKHCITDGVQTSIKGINSSVLQTAKIYVHTDVNVDIAVIELPENIIPSCISTYDEAEVLNEVLTLGFPQIPGFLEVVVGEKADISSRFYASKGAVASKAQNIWAKEPLFLITAKIRGGNSGGPVINKKGAVIGVSIQEPIGEGNYDDLGYGVVVPMDFVFRDIINGTNRIELNNVKFFDYVD